MGVIIRQSIKGTLVNYIGIAIGFVTTFFVLTHYLTTEEVGLTRVLVDAAVLFSSFAQLGTSSSIIRFFPYFKDEESKNHGFFFWTVLIPFLGFFIFLGVLFLFKQPIMNAFAEKSPLFVRYFRFVIPLSLFMLYQSVFEANSNVLMRIVVPKAVREVGIRLALLGIYLLYGFHFISLNGLVIGFCVTYFLAMSVDIFYLLTLQKISFKPDLKYISKPLLRNFLFYTLFLITAAIAGNITPLLNSFFVSAKMGLGFTGIFAIANYIATVIEIPNRSLNAIAQPNLSCAIKEQDWTRAESLCKSVSLHLLLTSAFIFFLIWINIDFLFQILPKGETYRAGKWVVLIMGMARLSNSVFSISCNALNFSRYYYMSLVCTFVLTASAIALNVMLIPVWGMEGAACSTLLSYLLYYIIILCIVKRKLHISVFSEAQLKVVALILGLFICNYLWSISLTSIIMKLPLKGFYLALIDSVVRTGVLLSAGIAVTCRWNISPEVNKVVFTVLDNVKKRKLRP